MVTMSMGDNCLIHLAPRIDIDTCLVAVDPFGVKLEEVCIRHLVLLTLIYIAMLLPYSRACYLRKWVLPSFSI